jgi:hypothetical protein
MFSCVNLASHGASERPERSPCSLWWFRGTDLAAESFLFRPCASPGPPPVTHRGRGPPAHVNQPQDSTGARGCARPTVTPRCQPPPSAHHTPAAPIRQGLPSGQRASQRHAVSARPRGLTDAAGRCVIGRRRRSGSFATTNEESPCSGTTRRAVGASAVRRLPVLGYSHPPERPCDVRVSSYWCSCSP